MALLNLLPQPSWGLLTLTLHILVTLEMWFLGLLPACSKLEGRKEGGRRVGKRKEGRAHDLTAGEDPPRIGNQNLREQSKEGDLEEK